MKNKYFALEYLNKILPNQFLILPWSSPSQVAYFLVLVILIRMQKWQHKEEAMTEDDRKLLRETW